MNVQPAGQRPHNPSQAHHTELEPGLCKGCASKIVLSPHGCSITRYFVVRSSTGTLVRQTVQPCDLMCILVYIEPSRVAQTVRPNTIRDNSGNQDMT